MQRIRNSISYVSSRQGPETKAEKSFLKGIAFGDVSYRGVHGLANLLVDGPVAKDETDSQKLKKAADMIQALAPALREPKKE